MVENLEYNSDRPRLIIPEYGRHIQKMVDYAVSIANSEERQKVAEAIIAVMGNLNPHLRDVPDFQHKLWDQLFIMADFNLEVDSPFPVPTKEKLMEHPAVMGYPQNHPKYRFYGNNIKKMIDVCNSWEEGDMKQALKYTIANHMKKSYLNWNKDSVEDEVIFGHLYELSDGKINLAKWDEDLTNSNELMRSRSSKGRNGNNGSKKHYHRNNNNNNRNNKKRH
ncbi:DUF4290 domain-containing protein [Zhouia sp. PK063]|uniref:DUF4290 domain-containing protein n=1 Tax=Zhouia sp. PK063 TaxID=3373602 RepID=UPI00379ACEDF